MRVQARSVSLLMVCQLDCVCLWRHLLDTYQGSTLASRLSFSIMKLQLTGSLGPVVDCLFVFELCFHTYLVGEHAAKQPTLVRSRASPLIADPRNQQHEIIGTC